MTRTKKRPHSDDYVHTDDVSQIDNLLVSDRSKRTKKGKQAVHTHYSAHDDAHDDAYDDASALSQSQTSGQLQSTAGCSQCSSLQLEVSRLNAVAAELHNKVKFLMSYLGIDDGAQNMGASVTAVPISTIAGASMTDHASNTGEIRRPAALSTQLRQAVVSAVYGDLRAKSGRANNLVIVGLPPSATITDQTAVCELISKELHIVADIKNCRRIGKHTATRPQHVLVTLGSTVQASTVLRDAKLLRQSSNEYVATKVFINPDLTRAEAIAAYEERCRRRQRTSQQHSDVTAGGQTRPSNDTTNTQQSAPVAVSAPNPMPLTISTSLQPQSAPAPYYTAVQPPSSQANHTYGMPPTGMPIYQSGQIVQQLSSYMHPSQQPSVPCQPDGPLPQFTYPMMANSLPTVTAQFFQPPVGVNSQTMGSAQ